MGGVIPEGVCEHGHRDGSDLPCRRCMEPRREDPWVTFERRLLDALTRRVARMLAVPRDSGFIGVRGSGCAGSAEWLLEPRAAETDAEYAERLYREGVGDE